MPWGAAAAVAGAVITSQAMKGAASSSADAQMNAANAQANAQIEAARINAEASKFRPVGMTTRFGTSTFTKDEEGNIKEAGYTLSPELKAYQDFIMGQIGTYSPGGTTTRQVPKLPTGYSLTPPTTGGFGRSYTQELAGEGYQWAYDNTTGERIRVPVETVTETTPGGATGGMADVQGLLGLGRGYLATSPEAAAADYMAKQRALYAGADEATLARIRSQQLQTGRGGLATGGTTSGMAATNPEMAAYYNALAERERQLAANADLAAQQRITFGQGLLSSAYAPIATPLGLAGTTEQMGQGAFDLGVNLGGRQTQANQAAAQLYQTGVVGASNALAAGQVNAAKTMQAANAYSPLGAGLTGLGQQLGTSGSGSNLGSWFSSIINPNNTASPWYNSGPSNQYMLSGAYMGGTSEGE